MIYKDKNAPVEKRVKDLINRMTLEEKVAQLCAVLPHMLLENEEVSEVKLERFLKNGLGRVPQFPMPFIKSAEQVARAYNKVQKYAVEQTRLGIPVMAQVECLNGVVSVDATNFPAPIDGGALTVDSLFGGGYTDIPSTPLYYFGYGLSYTTFEYLNMELDSKKVDSRGTIKVSCHIKNTGEIAGDEIVQLYLKDVKARVTRPVKELAGFKRITLQPGEIKKITFNVNMNQLGFYNENMEYVVEPGMMDVMIGSSSKDIHFKESFEITGEKVNVASNKSYLSSAYIEIVKN